LLRNPFAARLASNGAAKLAAVPADQAIPGIEAEADDGMFAALRRYPTYRKLWVGMLFASLGQWMQNIALAWIALDLTDSEFFVGLVGFMAGLPFLVVSIPAGVLVDRMDRRRLLLICQALAAVLAVTVASVVILDLVEPWMLLVAAFLNGTLQATMTPTQQSIVPALVERKDLTNAIALNSAGMNMTRVGGPFIAGAFIGLTGAGSAFILQAIALVVSFFLIIRIHLPAHLPRRAAGGVKSAFEGIRLIAQREDLRALFLLACIPTLFVFPYVQFLSIFARDILEIGAAGLGLLMGASGLGAVTGSLLTAKRRDTTGAGRLNVILTVIYGVFVVGIAASPWVWLTLPLLYCAGAMGAMYMSSNNALIQLRISDEVRGRVMAAYLLTFGLMPLGAMPMGIVADLFSTQAAVAGGAIASSVLAAVIGLKSRTLREI
jgi:MFS family permease